MNYFEFHIGDYAEATAHLSPLEDGLYWRLIRKYYALEQPLTKKFDELVRATGAKRRTEQLALERVLREFFTLREDGYHQARCDEVIAEYRDGEPERQAKRENEKLRKRRYRERRMELFDQLRHFGETPPWDTKTADLERLLERHQGRTGNGAGTRDSSDQGRGTRRGQDAPGTATQFPSPSPQSPSPKEENPTQTLPLEREGLSSRERGLNPRAQGTNPRANGTNHRADRDAHNREFDEAKVVWSTLVSSGGAKPKRDERIQTAIDAVGGWSAIQQRREGEENQLRRRFMDAYLAYDVPDGKGTEGNHAQH